MWILYYKLSDHDIDEALISDWMTQLPADKAQSLQRLQHNHKRLISVIGWQLLQYGMQVAGHQDFSLQQIHFPEHGKPCIPGEWDFNLSHSGDLVACAITQTGRVGIDVERHRHIEPQRFTRYFSPEELHWMGDNRDRFFELWTQKEAVIKASGIGLKGLSRVNTDLHQSAHDDQGSWYLHRLALDSDYSAHVATDCATDRIEHLTRVELAQLGHN